MTSQFPAPATDVTRLLLLLDAPVEGADALDALLTGYVPSVVAGEPDSEFAARLAGRTNTEVQADELLRDRGGNEAGAVEAVRELVGEHAGGCVLIVAGEAPLRALVCEALGVPLAAAWRFRVEAGAVSVVEVGGDGRWALVRLNERGDPPAG